MAVLRWYDEEEVCVGPKESVNGKMILDQKGFDAAGDFWGALMWCEAIAKSTMHIN